MFTTAQPSVVNNTQALIRSLAPNPPTPPTLLAHSTTLQQATIQSLSLQSALQLLLRTAVVVVSKPLSYPTFNHGNLGQTSPPSAPTQKKGEGELQSAYGTHSRKATLAYALH
mmetsp:Transcript_13234/g.33016  ORF Transcript_13234/g.33016 Transcript_13234/m.33016 type:complete len:113 (-) Transcript_13234:632-970(-)